MGGKRKKRAHTMLFGIGMQKARKKRFHFQALKQIIYFKLDTYMSCKTFLKKCAPLRVSSKAKKRKGNKVSLLDE